jgi:hypothetical protein
VAVISASFETKAKGVAGLYLQRFASYNDYLAEYAFSLNKGQLSYTERCFRGRDAYNPLLVDRLAGPPRAGPGCLSLNH